MKSMKKSLFAIFLSAFFLTSAVGAYAVESTPSAEPTNMEDRIKTLVKENISTTEAKLKEKVDLQSLVGYVGKIKTIGSDNLTVDSYGTLIQVKTTAKTVFQKDSSVIKMTSLAIGDKVILIGTSVKNDIIQAKKISIIKDEPVLVKTSAIVAQVVSVDIKKKTITLNIGNSEQTLTLSKKSTVKLDGIKASDTILGIIKEYEGKLSISRAKVL